MFQMIVRRRAVIGALCGLLAVVAAGCGGGSAAHAVPYAGLMPEGGRFSGVWYSPEFDQMYLRQIGDEVRGVYAHGYGGTIEGKIAGDLLLFKWIEPGDRSTATPTQKGRGYFKLSQGEVGWVLKGRWGYDDSETNGGVWTAERTREMDEGDPKTLEEYREKNVK